MANRRIAPRRSVLLDSTREMSDSDVLWRHVSATVDEIGSQPRLWELAAARVASVSDLLPAPGESVAAVGCGTSLYVSRAYAALRESKGFGRSDAFPASEFPLHRRYDRVVAISRSGTTTEVIRLLSDLAAGTRTLLTADGDGAAAEQADHVVVLDFADEHSVVQTRFATTALALLRAHLGDDLGGPVVDAQRALDDPLPMEPMLVRHVVFLGHGWTVGIAEEAALKLREASQTYSEAYPAMEYRHGPISLAGPGSLVWILGSFDDAVADDVRATGATVRVATLDPLAELVVAQRLAVAIAEAKGLDPDHPRHLTRSVVLS
jgi:CRISPR-associated protein Cas5a/b/c